MEFLAFGVLLGCCCCWTVYNPNFVSQADGDSASSGLRFGLFCILLLGFGFLVVGFPVGGPLRYGIFSVVSGFYSRLGVASMGSEVFLNGPLVSTDIFLRSGSFLKVWLWAKS